MNMSYGKLLATIKKYGGSSTTGKGTLRNIATRCRPNQQVNGTISASLNGTYHINLGEDIDPTVGIKVVMGNWYVTNAGEFTNVPGSATVYVAIEYPIHSRWTLATWGGAHFTTIAAGANATTDAIKGLAIKKGDAFKVRSFINYGVAGNFPISMNSITSGLEGNTLLSGDNSQYGWTPAQWTAVTLDPRALILGTGVNASGGAVTGAYANYPLAVLGVSNTPSVMIYGDSRAGGYNDCSTGTGTTNAIPMDWGYLGMGEVARSIGHLLPYCNLGIPSDTIQGFNASNTLRLGQLAYHTHACVQYGINDLTAGRTAATIESALSTAYTAINGTTGAAGVGVKVSQSTIPPVTTSTDSWATTTNQSTVASNAARIALNTWIMGKPAPLWAAHDVASVIQDASNSGIWRAPNSTNSVPAAITGDGTHETPYAYQLIQLANVIDPTTFS